MTLAFVLALVPSLAAPLRLVATSAQRRGCPALSGNVFTSFSGIVWCDGRGMGLA